MWVFINCLIENPTFDSQTKQNMTLNSEDFGSTAKISAKFAAACLKSGIVELVQSKVQAKDQDKMDKASGSKKVAQLLGLKTLLLNIII